MPGNIKKQMPWWGKRGRGGGGGGEERERNKPERAKERGSTVWKWCENCPVTVPWQAPSTDGRGGLTLTPHNLPDGPHQHQSDGSAE